MYEYRMKKSFRKAFMAFWSSFAVFLMALGGAIYSFWNMMAGVFYLGASISERRRCR